ncbi:MAG: CYTH domain-containing protein [Oleiphilaceae bacterium]|nr:CYTH domain-containing protein [Oleiphilaceae bacterium]
MPQELEIKLTLTQESLARALSWLAGEGVARDEGSLRLRNRYFDTPNGDLNANRVALRIRSVDGRYIQTLKTKGAFVNGAHDRQEWEWPVPGAHLDLSLLQQTPLDKSIDVSELAPVFDTDFERHVIMLNDDQTAIECAFDHGVIRAGDRERPLCELELELKSGDDAKLLDWATQLSRQVPVFLNLISKAEQGYYLAGLHDPRWTGASASLEALFQGLSLVWLTGTCPEGLMETLAAFESRAAELDLRAEWLWLSEQIKPGAVDCHDLLQDARLGRFQLALLRAGAGQ